MKNVMSLVLAIAVILSFTMAGAEEVLNGAGATFPYPLYSAWAYDYHKNTGVKLNYQSIGSGGGIKDNPDIYVVCLPN